MRYQINQNNKTMTTADQTLRQLGGRKFAAMTGATCFSDGANQETLVVKFKGSRVANIMYVTLSETDLYNVKICKYKNTDVKTIREESGVYAEDLTSIFEETTGLKTSL